MKLIVPEGNHVEIDDELLQQSISGELRLEVSGTVDIMPSIDAENTPDTLFKNDFEIPDDYGPDIDASLTLGIAEQIAERSEYALRGAWMAGYRYVHVYDNLTHLTEYDPGSTAIRLPIFVPAYDASHPREYAGRSYSHTYDLESVSDDVIKAAIDGEIQEYIND